MFKLSWKNFKHHFQSYFPAILVLAMGVSLINMLLYLKKQIDSNFNASVQGIDAVIAAKGSDTQIVLANIYHTESPTGNISLNDAIGFSKAGIVKKAYPLAYGDNYRGFRVLGSNIDYIKHYKGSISTGRYFTAPLEIVVGSHVAEKLNLHVGSLFHSSHGHSHSGHKHNGHVHDDSDYKVVGVLKETKTVLDNLCITPISSVWLTHGSKNLKNFFDDNSFNTSKELNKMLPQAHDHHDHGDHDHEHHDHGHEHEGEKSLYIATNDTTPREITGLLLTYRGSPGFFMTGKINRSKEYTAVVPATVVNKLFSQLGVGLETLKYIGYTVLVISILTLTLTLVRVFSQRKYELALLRVFGTTKDKLTLLLILESLWITIGGFIVGFIFSTAMKLIIRTRVDSEYQYKISSDLFSQNELIILLICIICGMISVILPLVKAYRIDISKTLASEK